MTKTSILNKITEIDSFTKQHVKLTRYEHSVRVAEMCSLLCEKNGIDKDIGYMAGIGHDMCKDFSAEEMIALAGKDGNPVEDYEIKTYKLLHGRAAAVLMKEQFGVDDMQVLEAVTHHTSGFAGMCDLSKILFIADKIEPGRPQSTDEYRARLLAMPLNEMFKTVFTENYKYIKKKGFCIYPATEKMVEYYDIKLDCQ